MPELLHRLAQLAADHALQLGDGAFHHAGEPFERTPNGDLGLHGLELALELLNLAQALRDDLGVLFVELFQAVELRLVLVDVAFQCSEFLGVMRAIGVIIRSGSGLQHALEIVALTFLAFDLVLEQRDLAGELAVGVMRLLRLGLGIADAALDDSLVDGVGFGGLLGHQAEPDEDAFNCSKHSFGSF